MVQTDGTFYHKDEFNVCGYHEFIARASQFFSSERSMANCFNCLIEGDYYAFLDYLDFSTSRDKAFFWSGKQDRVLKIARYMGWDIFNFTPGGRVLDNWQWLDKRFDWRLNYGSGRIYDPFSLWNAASEKYSFSASGKVGYFYKEYQGKIWLLCEKPVLVYKQKLNQVTEISYVRPNDLEEGLCVSESKADQNHSSEYLAFIDQISVTHMKGHSPYLYRDIRNDEKEEVRKLVFGRLREGDFGVIPALLDINDEEAIRVCREMISAYPQYSYAHSELTLALYKLTGETCYFNQILKCLENGGCHTQINVLMFLQSEKIDLKSYEYLGEENPVLYYNFFA